ncbi:SNF7 family protein [Entamoeba marina]
MKTIDVEMRKYITLAKTAPDYQANMYRTKAAALLRQKKQIQQHQMMSQSHLTNLNNISLQMDQLNDHKKVYDQMQSSNKQMKDVSSQFDVNSIQDIQGSLMNFSDAQIDLGDIMSQDISGIDLSGLDEELAQLGDEMFDGMEFNIDGDQHMN